MRLLPNALSGLILSSSVPAALAVSFNDFQPILGFPTACLQVYKSTIPGCRVDDFRGGNPCSQECINGVQSTSRELNNACVGARVTPTTLIGLFFQGKGVAALCPNFDPPPPPDDGGGGQTNTNPPKETTTSIDEPPPPQPTIITTTPTASDDTTRTLPPPITSTTETTSRWDLSGLQITIYGTDSGGTITANPTEPASQTTSSTTTTTGSDINNIAGSGNTVGMSSISSGLSLTATVLVALCAAAMLL